MEHFQFRQLVDFMVEHTGVDRSEVRREALVEDDLGVYGDDAKELILAFGKRFNVDVSRFQSGSYFSAEGDPVLPAIIRFFTGRRLPPRLRFTIGDMEAAIAQGRLDDHSMAAERDSA